MSRIHQPDWIARWALYRPRKVAVRDADTGRSLTYGALNQQADALAALLRERFHIERGDRIAVLAEFCPEYIILFAAALKAGFILVPLNYRLASTELAWLLSDAGPGLVLFDPRFEANLPDTPSPAPRFDLPALFALLPEDSRPVTPFAVAEYQETDPVFLLYTSGTTGLPKGALYTRGMLEWNSFNTALSLQITAESRTVNVLPPFHTGGWNVLITPFLHHGAEVTLLGKFDTARTLALLQETRSTLFMAVPTMLRMMTDDPAFTEAQFPDLLYLIVGGEPLPVPLIETWAGKGVPVRQGYGMTEVGPNLTSLHQDDALRKKGSIGRPNFYVQTRIVDETGQDVPPGTRGELWLKGPMVTPGYWRNPEATAAAFTDGWFRTGDLVVADAEHYLFVVDRLKHMFISGGENVYPAEVERLLISHPEVAEVAVVAMPDERWGEVGCAWVRRTDPRLDETALRAWCQERMARYKVPARFRFLEEMPRLDNGKLNKKALSAKALEI